MRALGAVTILVVMCGGCGGEEVAGSRQAVNGTVDDGAYPGVMGMFINKPAGVARCTGVLLAPNLVLTARHCVAPTSGGFVDCGRSPLGEAVAGDQTLSTILGVMPPDDLSAYVAGMRVEVPAEGDDECGFDIAAVILERPLDASEATPFPPRLDAPAMPAELVTAVGFGSDGGGGGLGVRRVREGLDVVCVGAADCGGPYVQDTELQVGDGGLCQFDSGAPILDADGRVVGVTSRGVNPCDAPILSATFAWAEWIRGLGRDAAEAGGYLTPTWAQGPGVGDAGTGDGGEDAMVSDAGPVDGASDADVDAGAGDDGGGCGVVGRGQTSALALSILAFAALVGRRRRRRTARGG